MDPDLKPTVASEIALPVRLVELKHLKTQSDAPVRVRCEAVDEVVLADLFGLPGLVDAQKIAEKDERHVRYLIEAGPALIHAATALSASDGSEIRPAFHADEAHAVPGSVPWRMLRFEDKAIVVETILSCSGYGGAASPSFPDGKRAGAADGAGDLAPGGAVREEPAGGPA